MKILFSPSKSQKVDTTFFSETTPILFPKKVKILMKKILEFSPDEIQKIFKLPQEKSIQLLKKYEINKTKKIAVIKLFSGTSFKELQISEYTNTQLEYMNNNLCILSAFYGILLPLNRIGVYRLDMNNNILKHTKYKNLYNFWSPCLVEYFKKESLIINLASKEYSKMIKGIRQNNIINIHFLTIKNGKEKIISVISKQQRGKILDYMIRNQIIMPSDIKEYSSDGFNFQDDRSDKNNYYFIKN